ncbi:MAG: hypothetical protein FJ030_18615 [Chloroflexi bacterium]|nr:hypothetical protein [Chloroflexota bacterium]
MRASPKNRNLCPRSVYITAWQAYQVEGHTWEALDKLHLDGALKLDDLCASLKGRGIPQEVYAQDLQELVQRGWVEESAGKYQLTAEGKRIREEAEALTDHYVFAPWLCLNESELKDYRIWQRNCAMDYAVHKSNRE